MMHPASGTRHEAPTFGECVTKFVITSPCTLEQRKRKDLTNGNAQISLISRMWTSRCIRQRVL
eukprot:5570435-Heterocapsa_arctica.AAC.1